MSAQSICILAISGSLKASSSNTDIVREISLFADPGINFIVYEGLENLPQFNPDKEEGNEQVHAFRQLLKQSDAVVISTPEYAFGIPGALKNALDWVVSSGELNEKPVIAISASPLYGGGNKALSSLLLTLSALGTKMDASSSLSIPDIKNKINNKRIIDAQTINDLKKLFDHLIANIQTVPE